MELSKMIIEYRKTENEELFLSIYETIHNGGKLVDSLSRKYGVEQDEVMSMVNHKLLDLIDKYDIMKGNFKNFFNKVIKYGCIDLTRQRDYEIDFRTDVMIEDEEGDLSEIYEVAQVAPTTTEDDIVNEVRKNRDQRQLIAKLLEKADEPTKLTVSTFQMSDSFRDVAKQLEICHKTVAARIRRLSRSFDQKTYGPISDYLGVTTTKAV